MRSRSWRLRNLLTTSAPKVKETPRSFSPQPCTSLSGSDHSRSHSRPEGHTERTEGEEGDMSEEGAKRRAQADNREDEGADVTQMIYWYKSCWFRKRNREEVNMCSFKDEHAHKCVQTHTRYLYQVRLLASWSCESAPSTANQAKALKQK